MGGRWCQLRAKEFVHRGPRASKIFMATRSCTKGSFSHMMSFVAGQGRTSKQQYRLGGRTPTQGRMRPGSAGIRAWQRLPFWTKKRRQLSGAAGIGILTHGGPRGLRETGSRAAAESGPGLSGPEVAPHSQDDRESLGFRALFFAFLEGRQGAHSSHPINLLTQVCPCEGSCPTLPSRFSAGKDRIWAAPHFPQCLPPLPA